MRRQALSYKTSALASLQAQIANGSVQGTEDWLLATANQLTLLDVSILDIDISLSSSVRKLTVDI